MSHIFTCLYLCMVPHVCRVESSRPIKATGHDWPIGKASPFNRSSVPNIQVIPFMMVFNCTLWL